MEQSQHKTVEIPESKLFTDPIVIVVSNGNAIVRE